MKGVVIFDLDGTLLQTIADITDNLNLMLAHYGYPTLTQTQVRKIIGNGARRLVKDAIDLELTESELDERLEYYNGFYTSSNSPKTYVFNGIAQTIERLKTRGYKIAILTNKPQETTDRVYKEYLSGFEFDMVIGASARFKHKPEPDGASYIMQTLGALPENTYLVGDGETDVLTAINAKINSVAALWGYRDRQELEAVGAKTFAYKPIQLLEIIK